MSMRTSFALAAALVLGFASAGLADGHRGKAKHRRHAYAVERLEPAVPPPSYGGRLVTHPAFNIACMTRDRATRAIPCDQPVWVYGSPCEIDLGLGRWRSCDEPPGIVHGAGYPRGGTAW